MSLLQDLITSCPDAGRVLGGYPLLLNIKPQVFLECLKEVSSDNLGRGLSQLFDCFLVTAIGLDIGADMAQANTMIYQPFKSWELDGVILKKQPTNELVVLETSANTASAYGTVLDKRSLTQPLDHLKQKLLSFSALRNLAANRLKYIFLCLFNDEIDYLHNNDTLSQVICTADSASFNVIGWPGDLECVRAYLRKDWWDLELLRRLYTYYVSEAINCAKDIPIGQKQT